MTEFDSTQAINEGWDIFDVNGLLVVQRIDCPSNHDPILNYSKPKFSSDARALIFIAEQAAAGSEYHLHALELVGTLAN